jgi:two-component system, sensor histidine kinase PdtaS
MGSHTCLSYECEKSLLELLKSFFEQGLKIRELCLWVVPASLGVQGARKAMGRLIKGLDSYIEIGQFELCSHKDVYLGSGSFDSDEALRILADKEQDTLKRGFSGLRVSGDASWLSEGDWDKFIIYEKEADKLISGGKITALCTYPAEKLDSAKLFRLSFFHNLVISKRKGKADILMDKRDILK